MIAKKQNHREVHRVEVLGDLFLQVSDEKTRFNGDAMNLSINGILFLSLVRLPLFREVDVRLQLPQRDGKTLVRLHCRAVVVRCERRVQPFYEISLFFMDMDAVDKHKIQRYIDRLQIHNPLGPR